MNGISALIEETPESNLAPSHREKSTVYNQKDGPARMQPYWLPNLGLQPLEL